MKNIKLTMNRAMLKVQKYSPEILITAGVVGAVTSTVLACKATTKLQTILGDAEQEIDTIKMCSEDPEKYTEYTEEDAKKDMAIVYTHTAMKVAKIYVPAVVLGTASLACIISSHNVLKKRNVALAAAYGSLDKGFKSYRKRVADRFGDEVEKQLRFNTKAEEITETIIDEKGKEKEVTKTIEVAEIDKYSEYSRFFDDGCTGWEKDPEYNMVFLRAQQQYANDLLRSRGHLYLNEVYDMLGIPRSKAGQVVGWIYDPENPVGDNYVDFGIYDTNKRSSRDFVNGYERTIILDFNVDGNILENM